MRQPPRYLTVTDCLIYGHADLYLDLEGRERIHKTKRMRPILKSIIERGKEAGKVEKEAAPNCSSGGTVAPSVDSQLQARGY